MADAIAVLNAGSSSVKFSLFAQERDGPVVVARGQAEGLHTSPRFVAKDADGSVIEETAWGDGVSLGHEGHKPPWDAFWGMRYAIVHDPDGNPVDLFAPLPKS